MTLKTTVHQKPHTLRPCETCVTTWIVSPSGRFLHGPNWESSLYAALEQQAARFGGSVRITSITCTRSSQTPASMSERAARAFALLKAIEQASAESSRPEILLFGLSIGAQAVLDVLSQEHSVTRFVSTLVLASLVIEMPVFIKKEQLRVHLVYGANDGVAYLNPDGSLSSVHRPQDYSQMTLANLFLIQSPPVTTHILPGANHLLQAPGNERQTLDLLCSLMNPNQEQGKPNP